MFRQNAVADNGKFGKQSNCRITSSGAQTLDLTMRGIDGQGKKSSGSFRWVGDSQRMIHSGEMNEQRLKLCKRETGWITNIPSFPSWITS